MHCPDRLEVISISPLSGLFLHHFIGNLKARELVTHAETETVIRGKVAFVSGGKISGGTVVGVVLRHNRIQVMAGHTAGGGCAKSIPAPHVLQLAIGGSSIIASSGKYKLPVQSGIGLPPRIEFNDTTHLSAIFRRETCGIDTHGIEIVGLDFRSEAGRAVVSERNTIDHELRLVFGTTGMQNSISFVNPSRLSNDKILHRTSRQRR